MEGDYDFSEGDLDDGMLSGDDDFGPAHGGETGDETGGPK